MRSSGLTEELQPEAYKKNPPLSVASWDIGEEDFNRLMRRLMLCYNKWDLNMNDRCRFLPASIVISPSAHQEIVKVSEAFAAAFRRYESRYRDDPKLARLLGIPKELLPLMSAQVGGRSAFCRADFFLTTDGRWQISEFNEDVPGGFNESVGVAEQLSPDIVGGELCGGLKEKLVAAFADCKRVGMVFATGFSEDLQHSSLFARWLEESGHQTVLGSPEQLSCFWGKARLAGSAIEGVFRFFPGEWMALLPQLKSWQRALPRLRMMNPFDRLIAQSKLSFALWQSGYPLADEDRWLSERYLPHTELFSPERLDEYRNNPFRWVIKRAFGRVGDAVLLGLLCQGKEWEEALAWVSRNRNEFCLQERFSVAPLSFPAGQMYPTIGAYTVDGRFAGYYSRVAPKPFISGDAYYVATVVGNT